jgi:hypothetical protein
MKLHFHKQNAKSIFNVSLSMKNNARLKCVQAAACSNNIKLRNEIHLVVRHAKSANNDIQEATRYISEHAQINQ